MSYKTIIVQADKSSSARERYVIAASLARREHAHLTGLATAVRPVWIEQFQRSNKDLDLEPFLSALESEATQSLDGFLKVARDFDLDSIETVRCSDDMSTAMTLHARYADLAILSSPDHAMLSGAAVNPGSPALVAIQSGTPVLMVPARGARLDENFSALFAWNASREARRALHFSLPLLKHAAAVHVAVIKKHGGIDPVPNSDPEPGADIALYLARHGLKVEVHQRETRTSISGALLALADDLHAELLVMGCYGHHRYREALLGGVTQGVLQAATLPVFMAH
jgi:nucleotide-binding universal stress UspA family protein